MMEEVKIRNNEMSLVDEEDNNTSPPHEYTMCTDDGLSQAAQLVMVQVSEQQPSAKKMKKNQVDSSKYLWTSDATEALIMEWKVTPNLFDRKHAEYQLKDKRRIAILEIQRKMVEDHHIYPAPSTDETVRKMNILRTYFNTERNKQEASKGGRDDVYESHWQYFTLLEGFLADHSEKRPKTKTKEEDTENSPTGPSTTKKSAGMLFGEMVAEIFEEIPAGYERDMMKMDVMKVMYDAKQRALQRSGVDYGTPLNLQT